MLLSKFSSEFKGLLNFIHLFEIISVIRNVSNLLFQIDVLITSVYQ